MELVSAVLNILLTIMIIIIKCYLLAESAPVRGVSSRVPEHWKSCGGFDVTEGQLMGQMRKIRISNWFTSEEMQSIKQEILGEEVRKKM